MVQGGLSSLIGPRVLNSGKVFEPFIYLMASPEDAACAYFPRGREQTLAHHFPDTRSIETKVLGDVLVANELG